MIKLLKRAFGKKGTGTHSFEEMFADAQTFLKRKDLIRSGENSMKQGEFKGSPMANLKPKEIISIIPALSTNLREVKKSYKNIDKTKQAAARIEPKDLEALESYATSLGVIKIGYVKLDPDDIFTGYGVLYDFVIVFSIEMNREDIEKAPSYATLRMIQNTYAATAVVANKIADFLKKQGYAAQGGPGLGGLTIYPLLAYKAGIGKFGRHGNILIPGYGARHRLGVVYTNIENLPFHPYDLSKVTESFCDKCGLCIKKCPAGAIHEKPQPTTGNHLEFIDNEKCVACFSKNWGCTVCIKVCPMSKQP